MIKLLASQLQTKATWLPQDRRATTQISFCGTLPPRELFSDFQSMTMRLHTLISLMMIDFSFRSALNSMARCIFGTPKMVSSSPSLTWFLPCTQRHQDASSGEDTKRISSWEIPQSISSQWVVQRSWISGPLIPPTVNYSLNLLIPALLLETTAALLSVSLLKSSCSLVLRAVISAVSRSRTRF